MQRARAARHGQDMAYIQIRGELPLKFRNNVACSKNIAFKHPRHARKLGLAEVVAKIGNSPSHWRRAWLLREGWHFTHRLETDSPSRMECAIDGICNFSQSTTTDLRCETSSG